MQLPVVETRLSLAINHPETIPFILTEVKALAKNSSHPKKCKVTSVSSSRVELEYRRVGFSPVSFNVGCKEG